MKISLKPTIPSIVFLIVLLLAILIVGPLFTIWSLNTLFPVLAIEYNFYTWLAALWLAAVLSGGLVSRSKQ